MNRTAWIVAALVVILVVLVIRAPSAETLSSSDYGDRWPLVVPEATVRCEPAVVLVAEVNGTDYALNGTAQAAGYPEIDPVWRDNPDPYVPKVSLTPLMDAARRLCE